MRMPSIVHLAQDQVALVTVNRRVIETPGIGGVMLIHLRPLALYHFTSSGQHQPARSVGSCRTL